MWGKRQIENKDNAVRVYINIFFFYQCIEFKQTSLLKMHSSYSQAGELAFMKI